MSETPSFDHESMGLPEDHTSFSEESRYSEARVSWRQDVMNERSENPQSPETWLGCC